MANAQKGDTVKVHYTGRLDDGSVFDTSVNRQPFQFTVGEGKIMPGFEQAVLGMAPGESKKVSIPAEEAYGPRRDDLTMALKRDEFSADMNPQVGHQFQLRMSGGRTVAARIVEISEAGVRLDANHPLAGHNLTFDLQLVDIVR